MCGGTVSWRLLHIKTLGELFGVAQWASVEGCLQTRSEVIDGRGTSRATHKTLKVRFSI